MTARDSSGLRDEIVAEASRWFVELNEHPEDESTRRTFDAWLRRSPEHVHAFLRISAHWEDGRSQRKDACESVEDLLALAKSESNVVNLAHSGKSAATQAPAVRAREKDVMQAETLRPTRGSLSRTGGRAPWRKLTLAAAVLLSAAGAIFWHEHFRDVYRTDIGEQRSLTLEDGSTVQLNSRTRIRVAYSTEERRIELLEGQALFHVAKNEAQPFIVQSRNTSVRAVGTQFDVYRKETGIVVTVVEGRVAAEAPSAGGSGATTSVEPAGHAPLILDAGEQVTLGFDSTRTADPARLEPAGIEAATAWTHRRLIFKGAPLSEVISEFNRYTRRPIVVTDDEIANVPISGVFSSSDPTDLLRFLREVGSYTVRETPAAIEVSRSTAD